MEKLEDFKQLVLDHTWVPLRPWNVLAGPAGFNIFVEGEGCRLTDIEGKTYIDYYSSLGNVVNFGYGRKEIADAAYEQLIKLAYRPTHEPTIPQIELAKKLADITPGDLSRVFFANSGTEAIETALKMARHYQTLMGFHNKHKIIVGGYRYHGSTYGSMSVGCNMRVLTWEDYETMLPGVTHVPTPPCFNCELGLKYPDCDLQCVKNLERVINLEMPETVAAFLDVPRPTEYATNPPPEYWPMVRSICDKYGILLIIDEVMMAFGRTGKTFCCEHWDLVPDIMTVAKSITNGYLPLGATIATKRVAQKFEGGYKEALKHSYTFDGHPVVCAAGLAALDIMEREKLVENSRTMGVYLFDRLQSLRRHRTVGEIRGGVGLDCIIEFVKNKETETDFTAEENTKFVGLLKQQLRQNGLWGAVRNPFKLSPQLIVTKDDVDEIVSRCDKAIDEAEKKLASS
jgi:adenosylmethionine-8-amino-7-oxononanoate aminotransferase